MSYFQEQTNAQPDATNVETEDYVAKVVAEKGEQWKDPAMLAKGYVSSQQFIEQLKKEKEELLQDLQKRQTTQDLIEELRKAKAPDGVTKDQPNTQPDTDIAAKVKEEIAALEASRKRSENLSKADAKLKEMYGDNAASVVEEQRQALGISKEKLAEIAADSPEAFLRLVGTAQRKETNKTLNGSVNPAALLQTNPGVRNGQYWNELRKQNPTQYHSPKMALLREKDFTELRAKGLW